MPFFISSLLGRWVLKLKLAQLELALVFSRRGLAERHFTQLVKHIQTAEYVGVTALLITRTRVRVSFFHVMCHV